MQTSTEEERPRIETSGRTMPQQQERDGDKDREKTIEQERREPSSSLDAGKLNRIN